MKSHCTRVWVAVLAAGITGCVAQQEADDLRTLYRKSQEQIIELQAHLEEAQARIAALAETPEDPGLLKQLAEASAERDRLREALAEAEQRIREAAAMTDLPPEVKAALAQLAEANPGLMSFDSKRNMVKLRSDLTFALGSAQVSAAAAATLSRLAAVLNSPAAQPYEVRVVGHTDSVPVRNAANVQKFGDNWGLSAFRAIAVKKVLQRSGVSESRLGIAGYADQQPFVANTSSGAEANRRVEIFLVAMSKHSAEPGMTAPGAAAESPVSEPTPAPKPNPVIEPIDAPDAFK